jgi:hypothetical protein
MSTAIHSTESRVADPDFGIETRKLQSEDWWFSKPTEEVDANGTTEAQYVKATDRDKESPATMDRLLRRKKQRPMLKQAYVIAMNGKRVRVLQQWECVVVEVRDDIVSCEMLDLTDDTSPPEFADVYLSEFSPFDRPLLEEGAVFYWSVGYEVRSSGTIIKTSELRVRRLPKLSKSQNEEISRKVGQLIELIQSD